MFSKLVKKSKVWDGVWTHTQKERKYWNKVKKIENAIKAHKNVNFT